MATTNGTSELARVKRRYLLKDPPARGNFVDPKRTFSAKKDDAVVIDLGSSEVRAGFASDSDPLLRFPPLVSRARDPGSDGRRRNFVGYDAMHTSIRAGARSPFELNVPFNPTLVERLMDGTIQLMGLAEDEKIDRPFVMTEPVCQMNTARAFMMEILFEGYQASGVCLGVDAMFSYLYNAHRHDSCLLERNQALVLSCGFKATHVLPIVDGRFYAAAAKRINVGGDQATYSLTRRLRLIYPKFAPIFTYDRINAMKEEVCYFSENYSMELERLQKDADYFEKVEMVVEIPAEDAAKTGPSPEEVKKQKQNRMESGKRLQEMMINRRPPKKSVEAEKDEEVPRALTEDEIKRIEAVLNQQNELEVLFDLKFVNEEDFYFAMAKKGFKQRKQMESLLDATRSKLEELQRELGENLVDEAQAKWQKRLYEDAIFETPDTLLSPTALKDKRRLKSIRGAAEARERVRQQKEAERQQRAQAEAEAARKKEEDPEGYLAEKIKERDDLLQKMKYRKAAREAGSDRRSQASRNRMRLLAQQSLPDGGKKGADNFGARDDDWNVYHDMQGGNSEEDEQDEILLANLKEEIAELAPELVAAEEAEARGAEKLYYPVDRYNEFDICIDRIRTPEVIWQPSIVGLDQCGLSEAMSLSLRTLPGTEVSVFPVLCRSLVKSSTLW